LSSKEQKIQNLEKAFADRDETSGKQISEIKNKLKLLFEEYGKAFREFGDRPALFLASAEISDFMNWIGTGSKQSSRLSLGSYQVQAISLPLSRGRAS
jgi:hypothetical protein